MTRLNQIIALEKGVKASTEKTVTGVYHTFQKPDLFTGLTKDYQPLDEADFVYPSESRKIVGKVPDLLAAVQEAWTRLFDLTFTKDAANQQARADIVIGTQVLATGVPVSTLIFLEKRIVDFITMINKVPVTDVAKDWSWDGGQKVWRATAVRTLRQKKVEDHIIVVPPTDKHPAQTAKIVRDVPEGHWTTQELSAALSPQQRDAILGRAMTLLQAVKKAREEANMTEVVDAKVGDALFDYMLHG